MEKIHPLQVRALLDYFAWEFQAESRHDAHRYITTGQNEPSAARLATLTVLIIPFLRRRREDPNTPAEMVAQQITMSSDSVLAILKALATIHDSELRRHFMVYMVGRGAPPPSWEQLTAIAARANIFFLPQDAQDEEFEILLS